MTFVLAPCVECGHGADEHRLHEVGISGIPMTANVEIVEKIFTTLDVPRTILGRFRCVADGCSCEDYVDEPLSRRTKKLDAQP